MQYTLHATRFNGFAMIHKALRAMLFDAATDLQQADYTDAVAMQPVLEKLENIIANYDDHADHEDRHILGIAAAVNPALAATFEDEHVTDRQLGMNLRNCILAYKAATENTDRLRAGHHIFYAFNAFIAFNLTHMNKEENELNEVLWAQCTDTEIMALNAKISGSIPPAQAVQNFTWMIRACNNTEISALINALRASAPAPILEMVLGIAQKELTAERLSIIQASQDATTPA